MHSGESRPAPSLYATGPSNAQAMSEEESSWKVDAGEPELRASVAHMAAKVYRLPDSAGELSAKLSIWILTSLWTFLAARGLG
jgi:hypothetical protein